jgi:hypothetical protein
MRETGVKSEIAVQNSFTLINSSRAFGLARSGAACPLIDFQRGRFEEKHYFSGCVFEVRSA